MRTVVANRRAKGVHCAVAAIILLGAGIGVISGMLGIGGGAVLAPRLILLSGFSQTEAQGLESGRVFA